MTLNAEACTSAFEGATKSWETILAGTEKGRLRRLADYYFEPKPAGSQCPLAALSGDAARAPSDSPLRQAFTAGLRKLVGVLSKDKRNDEDLVVLAAMVGALVLERASDDKDLTTAIRSAVLRMASGDSDPPGA